MSEVNTDWKEIWKQAPLQGTALAMWRLPNQSQQVLLQDTGGGIRAEADKLE